MEGLNKKMLLVTRTPINPYFRLICLLKFPGYANWSDLFTCLQYEVKKSFQNYFSNKIETLVFV